MISLENFQTSPLRLTNVRRDRTAVPTELQQRTQATDARYRDTLLKPFAVRGTRRKRLRAVLGHVVSFWTWRSLCLDHGLSNREATEAMTALVLATAAPGRPPDQGP